MPSAVTNHLFVEGDVDWVLHFASPASPRDYLDYPIHTLKVGALGSFRSLGLAKAKGAGFYLLPHPRSTEIPPYILSPRTTGGTSTRSAPEVRCPDITLAREGLGREPLVPIAEGIEKTVSWFRRSAQGAPA